MDCNDQNSSSTTDNDCIQDETTEYNYFMREYADLIDTNSSNGMNSQFNCAYVCDYTIADIVNTVHFRKILKVSPTLHMFMCIHENKKMETPCEIQTTIVGNDEISEYDNDNTYYNYYNTIVAAYALFYACNTSDEERFILNVILLDAAARIWRLMYTHDSYQLIYYIFKGMYNNSSYIKYFNKYNDYFVNIDKITDTNITNTFPFYTWKNSICRLMLDGFYITL
jgi:hypothetical protein